MSPPQIRKGKNIVKGYVYHEKQRLGYCAKHALNSLFQREEFTIKELDKICNTLTVQYSNSKLFNPHKSILPIGNYDVNVIMWALDTRGKEIQWFDNRHQEELRKLDLNTLFGIIINKECNGSVFNKHWYTLRPVYKSDARMARHEKILRPPKNSDEELNDNTNENISENIEEYIDKNINENSVETKQVSPVSPPKIPISNLTTTKTTRTVVTVDSNNNNYSVIEESPKISNENIMDDNVEEDYVFNWWNLDSKLHGPVHIISKEALINHLLCQIACNAQILLVYNKKENE